jgi:hypothetical protein
VAAFEPTGEHPDDAMDLAEVILGSHVLVGLTYRNADGTVDHQEQLHGFTTRVDASGVVIQLWGSEETYTLPPDLRNYEPAAPGEYRLRSTGEVVVDPDFISNWTITSGRDSDGEAATP